MRTLNKTWVQGDTSWKVVTLGMPVTIDLAAASGVYRSVFTRVLVVHLFLIGTYRQIRLDFGWAR
jgi:hypothetical protein